MKIEITKKENIYAIFDDLKQGDIFTLDDDPAIYIVLFDYLGEMTGEYVDLHTGITYDIFKHAGHKTPVQVVTKQFVLKGEL